MTRPNLLATIIQREAVIDSSADGIDCGPWHDKGNAGKAHPRGACIYCSVMRLAKQRCLKR